jgi:sugar lactone lactonase YvrE
VQRERGNKEAGHATPRIRFDTICQNWVSGEKATLDYVIVTVSDLTLRAVLRHSMNLNPVCIAASADLCGEGLVWDPGHECLYWTDINHGRVHSVAWNGGPISTWQFDQPATALTLTSDPELLVLVLGGRISLWSPLRGETQRLYTLPQWPTVRCNDARVSPAGSLWFGTMQNNVCADGSTVPVTAALGGLYSLRRDGISTEWDNGFSISNTVCWSHDNATLLFGDTVRNILYRYAYNAATDSVAASCDIYCSDFARGLPDGSALDAQGYLWNCRYGGGCIVRFALDGSVDRVEDTPVNNPTTCAFGGPNLEYLYFTSAMQSGSSVPNDGGLFCCRPPVPGAVLPRFRL